jgi:hypothetical protein
MMKKLMISVMAVAAISVAVPAAAQHYGPPRGGPAVHGPGGYPGGGRQAERLERQIDRAWQARVMSTGKAREYRHAVMRVVNLEQQYRFDRDGLTRWERQDIRERYQRIQSNLNRYNRRIGARRW